MWTQATIPTTLGDGGGSVFKLFGEKEEDP
jgi:hypothetical protein